MERRIDFWRERQMLCGRCDHRWRVDLDWIDRWEQAEETCPGCGMTCEHEDSPRVTVDPEDSALHDDRVARLFWYHTSTQPDWPRRDYDPAAVLTSETRRLMGGGERGAARVGRQRAKAVHVGTYEAAVHNMLRRSRDQADQGSSQFYTYRVRLKPSVVMGEGWLVDPSNFVGDVVLDEVCPPGVDAARYGVWSCWKRSAVPATTPWRRSNAAVGRGPWANARSNSSCGRPRWTWRPSLPPAPLPRQRARRCWCSASTARES
ncbi:hypothetical protein ACFY1L_21575 [Streptomyces sp. NPDC001663]|uniref:hypothetical protein n=1 Tax=Streptomyces sp. NPDC001663 TaxID=3364597 RepID=UPI0036BABC03